MNTFQAECFLALSKSLNFTLTAEELYISQPTLSRSIAALEKEIGVKLLTRSTKSVELTAAGRRFAEQCERFLDRYNRVIEETRLTREGVIGQLRIGIQLDAFEPFTVELMRRFRAEHPMIQPILCPLRMSDLLRGLNLGKLDAIVAAGELNLKHPGRLLMSERAECAVLPPEHPLAGRKSLKMEDLRAERFVAMSPTASTSGHYLLLHYAQKAGFSPNIAATVDSVPALMMQVACGVGVGILYQDLEPNAHGLLRFVPLENVEKFRRWLMWDADSQNPALRALLKCAEEFVSEAK